MRAACVVGFLVLWVPARVFPDFDRAVGRPLLFGALVLLYLWGWNSGRIAERRADGRESEDAG